MTFPVCFGWTWRSSYLNGSLLFAYIVGLQLLRLWQRSADRRPETDSWGKGAAAELLMMRAIRMIPLHCLLLWQIHEPLLIRAHKYIMSYTSWDGIILFKTGERIFLFLCQGLLYHEWYIVCSASKAVKGLCLNKVTEWEDFKREWIAKNHSLLGKKKFKEIWHNWSSG